MSESVRKAAVYQGALPSSLDNLFKNAAYCRDVSNYVGTSYVADPVNTVKPNKQYTQGALEAIAEHLKSVASQVNAFLDLQLEAVSSFSSSLEELSTRIELERRAHGQSALRQHFASRPFISSKKKENTSKRSVYKSELSLTWK